MFTKLYNKCVNVSFDKFYHYAIVLKIIKEIIYLNTYLIKYFLDSINPQVSFIAPGPITIRRFEENK